MFSNDGDSSSAPKALETVDDSAKSVVPDALESAGSDEGAKNVVKNMNSGELREVKWVDPAMAANTNPFEMSWYVMLHAYVVTQK